jgi:hypothetical protein
MRALPNKIRPFRPSGGGATNRDEFIIIALEVFESSVAVCHLASIGTMPQRSKEPKLKGAKSGLKGEQEI